MKMALGQKVSLTYPAGISPELRKRVWIFCSSQSACGVFNLGGDMDTRAIARELLARNILKDPCFTLKELFEIRDACMMLARYGLEDRSLLNETLKYIEEKVGE